MAKLNPTPLREAVGDSIAKAEPKVNPWNLADAALDAVPDGWAKVDGEWVRLRPVNVRQDAGRRQYEEV